MNKPAQAASTAAGIRMHQGRTRMEFWAHWSGVAAAWFTAAAALAGLVSWQLSQEVSKEKDAAIARFQEEIKVATSAADARAAEANARAESLRSENLALQRIMRPRLLYSNSEGVEGLAQFRGMKVSARTTPPLPPPAVSSRA